MRVALGHKARVGKDTIGSHLCATLGFKRLTFTEPLYHIVDTIQDTLGHDIQKDGDLMQMTGDVCRKKYGPDVFIKPLLINVANSGATPIVVTDMRFKNEMQILKKLGFITIRVDRPNRPFDRDPTHRSETELDDADYDYVIVNDGTIGELEAAIDTILSGSPPKNGD